VSGGVSLQEARAPDGMRLYAIGDVHGRLDLLRRMHERIEDDLARRPPADWRIVHLGDYIDRGPESKGVLDRLVGAKKRDPRIVTLMGNHDAGFMEFLRDADAAGLFARFGGEDTTAWRSTSGTQNGSVPATPRSCGRFRPTMSNSCLASATRRASATSSSATPASGRACRSTCRRRTT